MKILAIVGSPNGRKSSTYNMVEKILESARSNGAEAENIPLNELDIKYCKGCWNCFTEGECPQKDDIEA